MKFRIYQFNGRVAMNVASDSGEWLPAVYMTPAQAQEMADMLDCFHRAAESGADLPTYESNPDNEVKR